MRSKYVVFAVALILGIVGLLSGALRSRGAAPGSTMPAMTAPAETAHTLAILLSLRSIGATCAIYCAQFKDRLPENLGVLYQGSDAFFGDRKLQEILGPDVPIPADFKSKNLAQQQEWVIKNS